MRDYIYSLFFLCKLFILKIIHPEQEFIFMECYCSFSSLRFKRNNWGDDLNKYLFEFVTKKKTINFPFSKTVLLDKFKPYSLIGSIVTFYNLHGKTIYGSGIMNPERALRNKPDDIISVRGPETRRVLIENGIDCPEHYGDPALLLPVFYTPKKRTTNRGGIILNMGTTDSEKSFAWKIAKELNLIHIDLKNYDKWTDVIDLICSCDFIISESLHGLIVAETYGIPNVWVEFKNHPSYWNFKYNDYYKSIGKEQNILRITEQTPIEKILECVEDWEKADINYRELLSYFPFNIECPINGFLVRGQGGTK